MDRPKVDIEKPGKGFSRVTVTFPEDPRTTALNCAARLRRAASMAHGDPPQGVDPGVLDFEAGVLERLADRLPPARNCDVGTAADQARRFLDFCHANRTISTSCKETCPGYNAHTIQRCQAIWAQLPYEKGGAE